MHMNSYHGWCQPHTPMHPCNPMQMPVRTRHMHVCLMPMLISASWFTHHAPVEHFTKHKIDFFSYYFSTKLSCFVLLLMPCRHLSFMATTSLPVSSTMHTFCTYSPPPCQICFPFVCFCHILFCRRAFGMWPVALESLGGHMSIFRRLPPPQAP